MKSQMRYIVAFLIASVGAFAFATDGYWSQIASGQQDWATLSNWKNSSGQPLSAVPSGSSDTAYLQTEPVTASGSYGSAAQIVRFPAETSFAIGSVAGTWLHCLATYNVTVSGQVNERMVTVGNTSAFDGVWMGNALLWTLAFSGDETAPRLAAVDARMRATVNAPAGVTATIDSIQEPSGYLTKAGDGKLIVRGSLNGDAQRIDIKKGVLELEGAPDVEDAPGGDPIFWVDAARTNRMDLVVDGGRTYIAAWRDARADHNVICAKPAAGHPEISKPFFSSRTLAGVPVVDFGAYGCDSTYPADETKGPSAGLEYNLGTKVADIILVFEDTQVARASPVGNTAEFPFHRGTDNAIFHRTLADAKVRNGILTLDGAKVEYDAIVPFGRFHVLEYAIYGDGLQPNTFAIDRYDVRVGGVRIAEAIFYTNRLTHAERATTMRYLKRKWGDSELMSSFDVNVLATLDDSVQVSVPAGRTAKVHQAVVCGSKLVKAGAGTLKVGRFQPESPAIEVHGGAVAFDEKVVPLADSAPAADPIFWGDATEDCFESDANGITIWKDCRSDVTACAQTQVGNPTLVANACNGKRVLDFGTGPSGTGGTASWMKVVNIPGGDYPVREAVQLVRITNNDNYRPNIFGCRDQGLNREAKNVITLVHPTLSMSTPAAGIWTMNGQYVDPRAQFPLDTNEYYVASFSSSSACGAHYLATDRGYDYGDTQLGEVLLYDRVLSDAERRQTIDYLMKKWKGVGSSDSRAPAKIAKMEFASDNASPKVVADAATTIGAVSVAAGTLTKEGSGALTVEGAVRGAPDGIAVTGGSMNLAGGLDKAFGSAAFHVDASRTDTLQFDSVGRVERWYDCNGNGRYAYTPKYAAGDSNWRGGMTNASYVVSDGSLSLPAGKPYVDFGIHQNAQNNAGSSGMLFIDSDGSRYKPNVREFHVVFRTSGKNCTPIGGDNSPSANTLVPSGKAWGGYWANCTTAVAAPKMSDGSAWYAANAFKPDSSDVTDEFVVFSISFESAVQGWTFSMDRDCGVGGLKLCEAIIFTDNTNTTAMATEINRYLLKKWKGLGDGGDFGDSLALSVAKSATLRIADSAKRFSVPSVGGDGSIDVGDVLGLATVNATVDAAGAVSCVALNGAVTFANAVTVNVNCLALAKVQAGDYPILTADSFENAHDVDWSFNFTGFDKAKVIPSVRIGAKGIVLRLDRRGMMVIVK